MRSVVNALRHSVNALRHSVKVLRHLVKMLFHSVKTLFHSVKTLSHIVKTLSHLVKTLSHHNASNMPVFEVSKQQNIFTDHIFILKKNMSNVSCESNILSIYEVLENVENWKITKFRGFSTL